MALTAANTASEWIRSSTPTCCGSTPTPESICYIRAHLDSHLKNTEQGIRFITPNYKELFRIPDGDKIRITTSDGKILDRTCRYIDETHMEIEYATTSELFHICQFAEMAQRAGSTVTSLSSADPASYDAQGRPVTAV